MKRIVIFRQLLVRHRQVAVQNHQYVSTRARQPKTNCIALALSRLLESLDVEICIGGPDALNLFPRSITAAPLDKDDLHIVSKPREASDRCLNVPSLVPAGNDDTHRSIMRRRSRPRTCNHISTQAALANVWERRDEAVDESPKSKKPKGRQQAPFALDHLEVGKLEHVTDIRARQPILRDRGLASHETRIKHAQRTPKQRVIGDNHTRFGTAKTMQTLEGQ